MSKTDKTNGMIFAEVDFECLNPECKETVKFNLIDAANEHFLVICQHCHHSYEFDKDISDKLQKLRNLIIAIRKAEEILGDCNVAVTVPGGTVKIPYPLLLTRLNTMISLKMGGRKIDFHFRVEPSSPKTFR